MSSRGNNEEGVQLTTPYWALEEEEDYDDEGSSASSLCELNNQFNGSERHPDYGTMNTPDRSTRRARVIKYREQKFSSTPVESDIERPSVHDIVQEALMHADPTGATTWACDTQHRKHDSSPLFQILSFLKQWWSSTVVWVILCLAFSLEGLLVPLYQYLMVPFPGSLLGGAYAGSKDESKHLPPLSILVMSHVFALLLYSPRLIFRVISCLTSAETMTRIAPVPEDPSLLVRVTEARSDVSTIGKIKEWSGATLNDMTSNKNWIVFAIVAVLSSTCMLIALSLTSPVVVNAVLVMTTFLVHALEYRTGGIHPQSLALTLVTVTGGLLIVLGMTTMTSAEHFTLRFTFDPLNLLEGAQLTDIVGILFAIWAAGFYAAYMAFVRYLTVNTSSIQKEADVVAVVVDTDSHVVRRDQLATAGRRGLSLHSWENLFVVQCICIVLSLAIPSILLEQWNLWLSLTVKQGLAFLVLVVLVTMIGSLARLAALAKCPEGAAAASAFHPLYLVTQLFLAMVLLPDSIPNNLWQLVGIFMVQGSIIAFVVHADLRALRVRLQHEAQSSTVQLVPHGRKRTQEKAGLEELATPASGG